ncbi:aerotaxis receptor protein [Escherichia coli]|uniref:Aerotaxis receptor protein n=1 Tax=Escherichia coli TaxID=562 RepID=A0A2X1JDV3_ECOLX|nr:aerotaxis receptor protein [Escherichia coli]
MSSHPYVTQQNTPLADDTHSDVHYRSAKLYHSC